jgi:hypothetical protein
MTTHIERAVSEVRVEPEPDSGAVSDGDQRWQEQERIQHALERREWIQRRTRAEGFDD